MKTISLRDRFLWAGLMVGIGLLFMLARIEVEQFPSAKLRHLTLLFSPLGVLPTLYFIFYSVLASARVDLRERAIWTGIVSIFWAAVLGYGIIAAAFVFMDRPAQGIISGIAICLMIGLPSAIAQLMSHTRILGLPSWSIALAHILLPLLILLVAGRSQSYGAVIWLLAFSLYGVLIALQANVPAQRLFLRLACVLVYAIWLPVALYLLRVEGAVSAIFWPVAAITEHVSDAERNAERIELVRELKEAEPVRIGDDRFVLSGTRHVDGLPMRVGRHYVGFESVNAQLAASKFSRELDDPSYEVRLTLRVGKIGRCDSPEYLTSQLRLCNTQFSLNGLTGIVRLTNAERGVDESAFPARRMTALVADWFSNARIDQEAR